MLCRHLLQLSEITETVEAVAASRGQLHPAPAPAPPGQQRLQQCSLRSARESARVSRATITTSPPPPSPPSGSSTWSRNTTPALRPAPAPVLKSRCLGLAMLGRDI